MPMKPIPCSRCKRPRAPGGSVKKDGLCRICYDDDHRPKRYACSAGCGQKVSGPGRMCRPCEALRRTGTVYAVQSRPAVKAEAGDVAAPSWWVCKPEEFDQRYAEQLPRLLAIPVNLKEPNRDAFESA